MKEIMQYYDMPKIVNEKVLPVLYDDDTSSLVKGYNLNYFQYNMINTFNCIYKLLRINLLSLYIIKMHCIQFKLKISPYMI